MMAEAVGDRLEKRAPEMRRSMPKAEAGKGAACQRVLDRRLLAEKIGQAEDAVAAGRHLGGEPVELRMRLSPPASRPTVIRRRAS